jgi:hypothetical protein
VVYEIITCDRALRFGNESGRFCLGINGISYHGIPIDPFEGTRLSTIGSQLA